VPQKGGALFDFNNNDIRVIDVDGTAWFVAADICTALDMYINKQGKPNVTVAMRKLREDEIGVYRIQTNARGGGKRAQDVKAVSESGVYKLVMRSDKREAREFQDWVTDVVLPAIENDGGYIRGEEKVETKENIKELSLFTMDVLRKKLDDKTQESDAMFAMKAS